MKIKLFVFDFDGTALGGCKPYARFPESFVHFLDGLEKRGMRWITNTGWSLEAQAELLETSGVRSAPAMLIGQGGMSLGHFRAGRLARDRRHDKRMQALVRSFRTRVWPQVRSIFIEILKADLVEKIAFDNSFSDFCVIDFACRARRQNQVWKKFQPLIDSKDYYAMDPSRKSDGVLMPYYINKGAILQKIRNQLGIQATETLVAGDEANDIHMFDPEVAEWMVCPANANPIIKAAVRRHGGIVAGKKYSRGVIEGATQIIEHTDKLKKRA
jgi:hydroxymethylpyrimidine pyrophosphatase-like HAD family hydrolase